MSDLPPLPPTPSNPLSQESRLAALAERVGPRPRLREKPWFMVVAALVVAVLCTLTAVYWLVTALIHTRQVVEVPDLKGKTLEQALDLVSPLNLSLSKDSVQVDESLPAGAILRQTPTGGMRVREGRVVRVTISSGGQVLFVPDLVGVSVTEAQNRLRASGLMLGAMTQSFSVSKANGQVLEQNPVPGSVAKQGAMVDLKVSKGGPPEGTRLMPDFVGKSLSSAQRWAEEMDADVAASEEDAAGPAGVVLRQTPAPDSALGEKPAVTFVVSKSTFTSAAKTKTLRYELPAGGARKRVRMVLRDGAGEREIFSGVRDAGSVLELPVAPEGAARVRIFINDVLTEERPL